MKLGVLLSVLQVCLCVALFEDHETMPMRRRSLQDSNSTTRRTSKRECIAFLVEKQYQDGRHVDQPLECELQGEDLKGKKYKMVRVKGLTTSWAQQNNVTSGVTTIFAPDGAFIDDQANELIVPSGTAIKTVLVIRIIARDAQTTATEAQLADDIFGTNGDVWNLKTGFDQCSYGQLTFEPLTTHPKVGPDGIYTVSIPNTSVRGVGDSKVVNAALAQVTTDLGVSPNLLANHVMFCLPPGTSGSWIAYAIINGWRSVYNDKWCQYPSGQMHELGHNLNLAHSSEGSSAYGDQSGLMGYSYSVDETPKMCFNGANTWQLGWFPSFHVDIPFANSIYWDGNLVGFAERDAASSISDRMIIRLRSSVDYYVHFNRQIGMNEGTREAGNNVLVTRRATGTGYAFSYLLAKLSAGGVYTISNFNGSNKALSIVVRSIRTDTIPGRANISVRFGPSPAPTRSPTRSPTISQTPAPTSAPTTAPTSAPATAPTSAPITEPTSAPTTAPTLAPDSPTASPEEVTLESTTAPTTAPTESPTSAPTKAPTEIPTIVPSKAPTRVPTKAPTQPFCNRNGTCEPGENCVSCPFDCRGGFSGNPITSPKCCIGGACVSRCTTNTGWKCK
ncbi:Gametolysin peptidase M11 [Fragilaria crotonensis]|nr:Gametolysin peptidase M11 [Fragilaria crotonensis]